MPKQVDNGHAMEYLNAMSLHSKTRIALDDQHGYSTAHNAYLEVVASGDAGTLNNMRRSADVSSDFLVKHEPKIKNGQCIQIQTSQVARAGDVRDVIVILTKNGDVGISVKHNHNAVKHWRLPANKDFGNSWIGKPASQTYLDAVEPIYDFMRHEQAKGTEWEQVPNKESIYDSVLKAFEAELPSLLKGHESVFVKKMLGTHSFYQVVCNKGQTTVISFNMDGSLSWGNQIKLPSKLLNVSRSSSINKTDIVFNEGWQMSFRLHNGDKKIKPTSLKFDVRLVGTPMPSTFHLTH